MKRLLFISVFSFIGILHSFSQERVVNPDSLVYSKTWTAGFRLRSDGFMLGGEFTRSKKYKSAILYQFEFGYWRHPKNYRQQSQYSSGGFFGDGFKPFVYGKQNNLFAIHVNVGQRILLAEKARKHGVMVFFHYAGGFSLGILKPYSLRVYQGIDSVFTVQDLVDVTYDPDNPGNGFLDYNRIIGGSGFGKGWKLKFRPGIHIKTGFSFDWAKNEGFIKALEIGASADFYFSDVPIMVQNNKFMFPSVYVGFAMGKRKL